MTDFDASLKIVNDEGKANEYFENILYGIGKAELDTPTSASDVGVQGTIRADGSYIYICINTDTWLRASIGTW
jgi:hypothetical protein